MAFIVKFYSFPCIFLIFISRFFVEHFFLSVILFLLILISPKLLWQFVFQFSSYYMHAVYLFSRYHENRMYISFYSAFFSFFCMRTTACVSHWWLSPETDGIGRIFV